MPWDSLSSSALDLRHDRDRQQRVGHHPRLHQQRMVLVRQRVAGLGAGQLGDRADVAGDRLRRDALGLAERERERPDPLVEVVVLVAAVVPEKCPETCTVMSGRSVPENTRTSEIRPT